MYLIVMLAAFIVIVVFGMEFLKKFGGLLIFLVCGILLLQVVGGAHSIGKTFGHVAAYAIQGTKAAGQGFLDTFEDSLKK